MEQPGRPRAQPRSRGRPTRGDGGDLTRSTRWREILSSYGVGDEVRAAAVDPARGDPDLRLERCRAPAGRGARRGAGPPRAYPGPAGDGGWAGVEASRVDGGANSIAITFRSAAPDEVLALVSRAHGLSARERELVALLVQGLDRRAIADRLFISRYTVQEDLKSVFEKVGVRSRREPVSGLMAQAA